MSGKVIISCTCQSLLPTDFWGVFKEGTCKKMKALIIQKHWLLKLVLRDVKRAGKVFAILVFKTKSYMRNNKQECDPAGHEKNVFENVALSQEWHFCLRHFVKGS